METIETLESRAGALSQLVTAKFGPKGPDLRRQARKLGRRVPKSVRSDLDLVGQAAHLARHPRLSRLHQPQEVEAAADRATAHLESIDPANRRRGLVLSWVADNVINLMLLAVLFIAILRIRGIV